MKETNMPQEQVPSNFIDCENQIQFTLYFNTHRARENRTPVDDAQFALGKLKHSPFATDDVRLTVVQEQRLRDVMADWGSKSWNEYCDILTPKQIQFVGW